jgi:hypothetical protein
MKVNKTGEGKYKSVLDTINDWLYCLCNQVVMILHTKG